MSILTSVETAIGVAETDVITFFINAEKTIEADVQKAATGLLTVLQWTEAHGAQVAQVFAGVVGTVVAAGVGVPAPVLMASVALNQAVQLANAALTSAQQSAANGGTTLQQAVAAGLTAYQGSKAAEIAVAQAASATAAAK